MKRIKVFQRNDSDCGTAGIATLLGIPYEDAPQTEDRGIDLSFIQTGNSLAPYWSSIDEWMEENGYQWGRGKVGRFWNPRKYSIGVIQGTAYTIKGFRKSHMVIMKGRRIWHDPYIGPQYDRKVAYCLTIEKIIPEATP